ncbi:unnamed protein product [Cladocopium goreaui]|uniref:Uncharacterized protein n=1 Tax=Cladocopium goreaui TaxID=2562237 RepID=A0A9P1DFT6_9DINO|nr:unnamed protein product [Cladocopium goreaui]
MGCGSSRGTLAQRLEGLDGEAAKALVAKEVQKGLDLNSADGTILAEAVLRRVKAKALEALLVAGAKITSEVHLALLTRLDASHGDDPRSVVKVFVDHGLDVNLVDPSTVLSWISLARDHKIGSMMVNAKVKMVVVGHFSSQQYAQATCTLSRRPDLERRAAELPLW